jgi:hypothetical protein
MASVRRRGGAREEGARCDGQPEEGGAAEKRGAAEEGTAAGSSAGQRRSAAVGVAAGRVGARGCVWLGENASGKDRVFSP